MSAKLFVIKGERGDVVSARSSRKAAEAVAARIGGSVEERAIEPGDRVRIFWHGWEKNAVVVEAQGARVSARFIVGPSQVVKSMSVDKIEVSR